MPVTITGMTELQARLTAMAEAGAYLGRTAITASVDTPYARFVEEGTAAHDIYPNSKKALFWPGARHPVGHVHIPAIPANPFMDKSLADMAPRYQELIAASIIAISDGAPASAATDAQETARALFVTTVRSFAPMRSGMLRASATGTIGSRI